MNAAQQQAVQVVDGPLLILAGPGSGKTRTVTHRIAYLLEQGIPGRQILALTFTNHAADEMASRLETLSPGATVWTSTFHKFCARLLRKYAPQVGLEANYTIYDADDSQRMLKRVLQEEGIRNSHFTPQRIANWISRAKNNLIRYEQFQPRPGDPLESLMAEIYPAYQRRLYLANACDFDDLLLHVANLLRDAPEIRQELDRRYRYILVDEYQDTNLTQYGIVRALSLEFPNLCVTGDPDQSIYGWRGANIKNILEFEKDYPSTKVVRLEENYRSTPAILRAASCLIEHNQQRKAKALFTKNPEADPVRLTVYADSHIEADSIALRMEEAIASGKRRPKDFAILYRTNALSVGWEAALRAHRIPYRLLQGIEFYQRKEIKDVLSYLQLLNNPQDENAFLRCVNTPSRGIGQRSLDHLLTAAKSHGSSLLEAARSVENISKIAKRSAKAIQKFVKLYDELSQTIAEPVEAILGHVLTETEFLQHLRDSDSEEDQERLSNVEELLSVTRAFDEDHGGAGTLEDFLEQSSLVAAQDDLDGEEDRVTLMTFHASKGLEFPVVCLVALEEGFLPHENSKQHPDQIEEERRLFFVGITRAKEELWLSQARIRLYRGRRAMTVPSSFLFELPREELALDTSGGRLVELDESSWESDRDEYAQVEPEEWKPRSPADLKKLEEKLWNKPSWQEEEEEDPLPESPPESEATAEEKPDDAADASASLWAKLSTAADLSGGDDEPNASTSASREDRRTRARRKQETSRKVSQEVEQFATGMAVRHPHYGLGKIIALSGTGINRKATVRFVSQAGEKSFVLAHSPLVPTKKK
ncbi:ATP-dependent DNA helicase [Planctomycetales bacterium 10988]|nr:ATP-dependent DNA helicase [Planctomycetales bacterium 10988]